MATISKMTETTSVYFEITGLPKNWVMNKSFTNEVDNFLKANGLDRFGINNMETMMIFIQNREKISPEKILEGVNFLIQRYFGTQ